MNVKVPAPMSLTELLLGEFGEASRSRVKKMIARGRVKVNGRLTTNPVTRVSPGDRVEYTRPAGTRSRVGAPYPIIHEDDCLLVVDKPAGILTVGERGQGGTSVYRELLDYVKENTEGKGRLFVVHRLDREVSGLLLFAKTEVVQQRIKGEWKTNRKRYYALVEGIPENESGIIRSWLREGSDQKVYSTRDPEGARMAVTRYRIMDRTGDYALLEIELETGRKNQIRVHLAELGCPVVGDRRYGAADRYVRRIRLHAFYLSLKHPESGALLEFKSRMPKGFLVLTPGDEKYK